MKKLITLLLLIGLCVGLLVYNFNLAASQDDGRPPATQLTQQTEPTQPIVGQVRIANSDPDMQTAWETLARDYTSRTGISVSVVSGQDETATLFTIRSQEELAAVQDQCLDLSGTGAHAQLASWDLTLKADGKVCGIAAEIEGFGLMYNSALLGRIATPQEITGLSALKNVAEAITADADLDFAAFACPDLDGSFLSRMVSMGVNCREFWQVYAANSACLPGTLNQTDTEDSLLEFVDGKAVFCLGSTAEYDRVSILGDHNLGIMPLYLGGENEQRQGLCVTCSSYWCVRGDGEPADVQATLDFLNDLVHPREDGTVPVDDLRIVAPYRQATFASNPLERTLRTDLLAGKEYVVCTPMEKIPEGLTAALTTYAIEPTDENWAAVAAILGE
jgi:raffinose/stachyose/melibiose transport system substrate-binding protein